nr:M56 family metallopeptidase [Candidatus Eremiobacteraeota bacterium]
MIEAVVGVALRAILASVLLGGVLAALVLVATRTLALTAATRHALWTTALIATAVMPLAGIGMSIVRAGAAAAPVPSATTTHTVSDAGSSAPAQRPSFDTFVTVNDTTAAAKTSPPAPSLVERLRIADRLAFAAWTPRVSHALALGVVGVWAFGALAGLIGLAASVMRVRGLKRRSSPLDGALADELPWLTEVGPGREIYLRLSYETETPVAIGFRRPVILIPTELASADGLAAIESLILHEHAHLRRNDDWTNLLQRAIERVFWFNPIVWFVGRRIALEREIASDDAVVEKTGEPHAYATSLWKLVREMRMPEHAVVAPGALLTRKQITVRIEQLLDKKRARLHRSPVAALAVAVAGMLSV